MIVINGEKCIGCGSCVKDCSPNNIEIVDSKARVKNATCLECGHCIAVCPMNIVSSDEYDMSDVKEYDKNTFDIKPENLLNFIKFRRSIRQFKNQPIEDEKLLKIIEAGRFTATAANSQKVSYVVVREKNIPELRRLALESLCDSIKATSLQSQQNPAIARYAQRFMEMYESDKKEPGKNDGLFFNAPAVILIAADSAVDAALAASNMELMTFALGLGTFYSGFLMRAVQGSAKISNFLGLADSQSVKVCLVLGYPDVTYLRTVPRKSANIIWR
jgi:nitroreductase/NAD-dependent dihydropyrimidine dehydrogenase PreA subunit